ncbi:glycosyltransferase family 2 protein [Rhodoferax antarcticus]|uniref:glycosyltransferase family 2 protein n=1 Tax=Rhodoferax antarcticus TaxID=81479 RepID=UPI0022243CC2|nr:glycosyltransferase [Rhodoferax antarcticus]MCW2313662.1 glycosyltransferase involved in cell wall biosynthesis [Rhodoferax antarcticus]
MSNASPLVSVCIPTFRGAETIGETIELVLAQTLSDFELIVIDDGSTDSTSAIVAQFSDPRLRYLRNEHNLGPEGNWNRCLEQARGKYFKLLPHDDLLYPECLARQVEAFEADFDEHIALAFSARNVIGPRGKVLTRRGYPGALDGRIASNDILRVCVRRGTNLIGEPGAVLMRKSLADRVGNFDGTNPYVIDLDYWFRLLAHGAAWYNSEPLAAFRVSSQQWSVVIGAGQSNDFRNFLIRTEATKPLPLHAVDRFVGLFTPTLNNFARLLFYRLYLR